MNYTGIVTNVTNELNRNDLESFYSDWIERTYRDVMAREAWTWLNATSERTTVQGSYRYELPSDFYDSTEVRIINGTESAVLEELQIDEFDRRFPYPPSDAESQPQVCAIHHGKVETTYAGYNEIVLWPVPDDEYTLSIRYEVTAPTLSGTMTPIIPTKYHAVLVYGTLQHAFARLREYESATYWESQKERLIATMIREDREMPNQIRRLREFRPELPPPGNYHLNPFIRRV